ncbi:hypothetical protein DFP72DRAFT_1169464 [Ephemerocybe angulata]|uniref:Uncharacterized protein n=1 Tax=Ephemerocybe angulata TaxID=980116 RepID=A0A8H6M906_9AGAR|nr:hypothetical protein DFP72DRAFT_1169464 [Tulosesus angulatus]
MQLADHKRRRRPSSPLVSPLAASASSLVSTPLNKLLLSYQSPRMPSHRRISVGRRQRMRIDYLLLRPSAYQQAAPGERMRMNEMLLGLSGSAPLCPGVLGVPSTPTISQSSITSESSNSTTVSPRAPQVPIGRTRPIAGHGHAQPVVSSPSLRLNTPAPSARMDTPTPSLRMDSPTPSFQMEGTPALSVRMDTPAPSLRMDTPTPSCRMDTPTPSSCRMDTPTPSFRMETPTPSIEVDHERNDDDDDDALSYISMDTIVPARRTQVDMEALRESLQYLREAVRVLSVMIEGASST